MKDKFIRYLIIYIIIFTAMWSGWYIATKNSNKTTEYYTFTNFADSSHLYIRKDCICTVTSVSGDVYIVPINGNSIRVRESMNEVREIVKID